jgi:hypothetical protein
MNKWVNIFPLNVHLYHPEGNIISQCTFKLKVSLAAAENWHLKGHVLKVKHSSPSAGSTIPAILII